MAAVGVRVATIDDLQDIIKITWSVGIPMPKEAAEVILKLDPQNTHVAENSSGNIIGYIACIKCSNKIGMLALIAVLEEFQNRGIGKKLLLYGLPSLQDHNIFLNSVSNMVPYYQNKYGFSIISSWKINELTIPVKLVETSQSTDIIVKQYIEDDFDEIHNYDQQICPIYRKEFLSEWLSRSEYCVVAFKNKILVGCGALYKANKPGLYLLQPLYADNYDIAKLILSTLINSFMKTNTQFKKYSVTCTTNNMQAICLAKELGGEVTTELTRMYTKEEVKINVEKVFSAITFISII